MKKHKAKSYPICLLSCPGEYQEKSEAYMSNAPRQFSTLLADKSDLMRLKTLQHRSFTLIELLMVITIIIILAATLLPALKNTKEFGKSIKCAGNLKQIGISLHSYADDFQLYLPCSGPNSWSNWADNLLPYLNNKTDLFYCPNAANYQIRWKLGSWTNGLTYGTMQTSVNSSAYLSGKNWAWQLTSPALQRPLSRIAYATDANNCWFMQTGDTYPYDLTISDPYDATYSQPLKRHPNSCNILYLDDHCSTFNGNMLWGQSNNIKVIAFKPY